MATTLVDHVLQQAADFRAGQRHDPAVDPTSGERFAVRLEGCAAVDLTLHEQGPQVTRVIASGDLVATDRRLFVANGRRPVWGWEWGADLQQATVLREGYGVALLPAQRHFDAGQRLWGVVTQLLLRPEPLFRPQTLALLPKWYLVTAAWAESAGRFDEWQADVREVDSRP